MKKSLRILRFILIPLFVLVLVFAGYQIFVQLQGYSQGKKAYQTLNSFAEKRATPQPNTASSSGQPSPTPGARKIDFAGLTQVNPQVVGWLEYQGTVIDYPMVQGEDNEYYLTHLFDNTENKLGAIYLDYRNTPDFSDPLTVVYGHNMDSGDMFADLLKLKDPAFFSAHPKMELYTPDKKYRITLLAGYEVSGLYDPWQPLDTPGEFESYLASAKENSFFSAPADAVYGDKLVLFYTCTYTFENARFAVLGRLNEIKS